jgi:hypothetical protein
MVSKPLATGWIMFALLGSVAAGVAGQDQHRPRDTGAVQLATETSPSVDTPMLGRSSVVVLKAPDFSAARQVVIDTAGEQGAVLLGAYTAVNEKGRKHGWLKFRVSPAGLARMTPALYGVGKLYSDKLTTTDSRSDYEELARRVGSLQQHERRLDAVLGSGRRMRGSDVLYLQERLFRANVDEGMLTQQRLDLERGAEVCTIQVSLFEPGAEPQVIQGDRVDVGRWFASSLAIARGELSRQMARAATGAAYAVVYSPFWGPAAIAALVLLRMVWVRRRRIARWATSLALAGYRVLAALFTSRRSNVVEPES